MSVILLILKIIGILLLILLGLLLLFVLLVLLVPVHYHISGEMKENIHVQGRLSWLFRILYLKFTYQDEEVKQCIRIFGIRFRQKTKPLTEEELFSAGEAVYDAEERMPDGEEKQEAENAGFAARDAAEQKDTKEQSPGEKTRQKEKKDGGFPPGKSQAATAEKTEAASGTRKRKKQRNGERKNFVSRFREKLSDIREKFSDIKSIIVDETNKKAVFLIWPELRYLLSHFRFRKIRTELDFSLGDPALTGQALGILCVMPFLYRYQIGIRPDFESDNVYLKGTFEIAGRVRLAHLLVSLIRLWRVKEFRVFIKRILK